LFGERESIGTPSSRTMQAVADRPQKLDRPRDVIRLAFDEHA